MTSVIEQLQRWEASGGTWYAVGTSEVVLCRCDGGEVAERLRVDDQEAAAWLLDHPASEPSE